MYLKRWKDPGKAEALHLKDKEEMEIVMSRLVMFSRPYNNRTGKQCTTEKRNDLFRPEPTTELVTSCLSVPVPWTQKLKIKGPTMRAKSSLLATMFLDCFRTPTATLPRAIADGSRLERRSRSA